jgi:elongation factor Ts
MAEITAAAVKALRDKTQLPMMECKRALVETGGDEEAAIRLLREQGKKTMAKREERTTDAGRLAIFTSIQPPVGTMIELQCESAPVASNTDFLALANDLAKQLALGPGAKTPDELWAQKSPSKTGLTLMDQKDELANKIREVFRLTRIVRIDGACGGYVHHTGGDGVLLEVTGASAAAAKDIAMHICAQRPKVVSKEDLDPALVKKEREILVEQARGEGKPENIIEKMVDGRMRDFYAREVLAEQPFIKDDKTTVGKYAQANGLKPIRFVHWQLGRE